MRFKCLLVIAVLLAAISFLSFKNLTVSAEIEMPMLTETAFVNLNCTTAEVSVGALIMSNETLLIHFPEGVDMGASVLANATVISLGFSREFAYFLVAFEGLDETTARANADAIKPDIESAFSHSFMYNSSGTYNGYVNVTYTGEGISDLGGYLGQLMNWCLNDTIEGFSETFPQMVSETTAMVNVMASKETGDFNWVYSMTVHYSTSFPIGSDSHTIDVLSLLHVTSLAPSQYALMEGEVTVYFSQVNLNVVSNDTINFVDCVPDEILYPMMGRGWYVPSKSGLNLTGIFYFGSDGTPVEELTFSFSGVVIPEFTRTFMVTTFFITTTLAVILKRRKKKLKLLSFINKHKA